MRMFVIDGQAHTGRTPETIARRVLGAGTTVRKGNAVGTGTAYTIRNRAGKVVARGVFYA